MKNVRVVKQHAEDCDGREEPFSMSWWFPDKKVWRDALGRDNGGLHRWAVLECTLGCDGQILVNEGYLTKAAEQALEESS